MDSQPLYSTKKEGRYLIRMIGAGLLLGGIIYLRIRNGWFLPATEESTPRWVFLLLLVIPMLIYLANWVFRKSYIHVYKTNVIFKAYNQEDPIDMKYQDIKSINGSKGTYIDLPGIDLDTSNILTIETKQGKKQEYNISCSRKSFQKILRLLLETWEKSRG